MEIVEKNLFIYKSLLSKEVERDLPRFLQIDSVSNSDMSSEAILFRLLLGTVGLKYYRDEAFIEQKNNYSFFGGIKQNENDNPILDWLNLNPDIGLLDLEHYFKINKRKNENLFQEILSESSHFFYFQGKKEFVTSFLHLYRFLEFTSYCFPIIYASRSSNYFATYDTFKSYFKNEEAGRLKFYKGFIKSIFDEPKLRAYFSIDTIVGDSSLSKYKHKTIMSLCKGLNPYDGGQVVKIPYSEVTSFIINLRNRYFHFFSDRKENISSTSFDGHLFFESLKNKFKNWLSLIYFEVLIHSIYKQILSQIT